MFTYVCIPYNYYNIEMSISSSPPPEFHVFKKHYKSLAIMLFNTNLTPHLIQEGVIVPMDQEELSTLSSTKKAENVLLKVSAALESGLTESFHKILNLMKSYGNRDAQQLSTAIENEVSTGSQSNTGLCYCYKLIYNQFILLM